MKKNLKTIVLAATVASVVAACAPAPVQAPAAKPAAIDAKADWPKEFVLGMFAGDDAEKILKDNEFIRARLEKATGIPVKIVTGTSYSAVIEAMRNKKADAMVVGPFSYVLAVQEADAEALAVNIYPKVAKGEKAKVDPTLKPFYYSVLVTKKGSGIKNVSDLKGKDFAFVDPASTSGHLMPKTSLLKAGIDPDKDMKVIFAGTHPSAVQAVWNGKVPAAATFEQNLYDLQKNNQIEFCAFPDGIVGKPRTQEEVTKHYDTCKDGQIVPIFYSVPIPETPFAVRRNLPNNLKQTIKESLLSTVNDAEFVGLQGSYFVDPSKDFNLANLDNFYDILRDAAKFLNLDLKKMK